MKNLFIVPFLLLFGTSLLNAQDAPAKSSTATVPAASNLNDQEIRIATEKLTEKYALNADQAKQLYRVLVRKERNLAEIEGLQQTDPPLYRKKVQNVQQSTLANLRRILNTKEQVEIYQKTQSEIRTQRNQKQKELLAKRASKEEIENALLAIYAE